MHSRNNRYQQDKCQLNIATGNAQVNVNGKTVRVNEEKACTGHRDSKNYIVNGDSIEINKNIYIKGNLIVNGDHHIILSGKAVPSRDNLIIEGDFIVNGTGHDINDIVSLYGQLINNSSKSIIR